MIEMLKQKPDCDKSYIHLNKQKNLKVTLLEHQCYPLGWFKWRERTYPHEGIFGDDMGLGKTLTVLAYLNLVKYCCAGISSITMGERDKEQIQRKNV